MNQPIPKISVVIIVYNMARQAMNTLYSLSPEYQKNIDANDYEIIVVENHSCNMLDKQQVEMLSPNIRYFCREEKGVSPVPAINFGFQKCRAPMIGLMIDGARMVTPRIIEYTLMAQHIDANAVVAVPGYNLGPAEQQYAEQLNYNEAIETAMLSKTNWQKNGYRLFDISSIGGANPTGVINPLMESNCVFASKKSFEKIGWADEQFTYPGGGSVNLHIFRSLGMLPESNAYFILPGEASFHQLHGGVTTANSSQREAMLKKFAQQLNNLWGVFSVLKREPILLGAVTSHAQPFLKFSADEAMIRFDRLSEKGVDHWVDDVARKQKIGSQGKPYP
ncbi:MAG: glycosyltransferase [Pseudomonadales bacterium]|nr:glycosyltransferase [Pseudomonadales bacterium]